MYRIVCESYQNYLNTFNEKNYRLEISKPIELIVNKEKYNKEKQKESKLYKQTSDLIYFMQENVKRFPKIKAFLWTLESRNMQGKKYNEAKEEDLEEQIKLVNSFLKLAYWS